MPQNDRFENYQLLRRDDGAIFELGRGAMGVTYKAFDTDLHCTVALKVINPGILTAAGARERFLREARAAARVRHPNIAAVYRLGRSADATDFYAMEFCEGPTLAQAIAQDGPFPPAKALGIVRQVSKALILAEEHRLLHRDLKPSNLILTERPDEGLVVKVIDFGLAKSLVDGQRSSAALSTGGFVGTAQYASPEQLEERELDIRSDIYSIGACLWFMLTGRAPFEGSLARVMSQALTVPPPWEVMANQPPPVGSLLRKLLAKDRAARPQTAAALREEVEACLQAIGTAEPAGAEAISNTIATATPAVPATPATASACAPLGTEAFNLRFPVSARLGRDFLGRIFQASDRDRAGAPVIVRALGGGLIRDPAVHREIADRLQCTVANPHPHLQELLAYSIGGSAFFVASPRLRGFTLANLLEARGRLEAAEALRLLGPLAEAADHAARHQVAGADFCAEQIAVAFSGEVDCASALKQPIGQWPAFEIKAGVLSLGEMSIDRSRPSPSSVETVVFPAGVSASATPVRALANLAVRLLGRAEEQAFAPLPGLPENANAVLSRALSERMAYPSAAAFFEALRLAMGGAERPEITPRRSAPAPISARPRRSRSNSALIWAAVAAVLCVAAAAYWYGLRPNHGQSREGREPSSGLSVAKKDGTGTRAAKPENSAAAQTDGTLPASNPPEAAANSQVELATQNNPSPAHYADAGFVKDGPVVTSADGALSIEQWSKLPAGSGATLYQSWVVPKSGAPVQLPEAKLDALPGFESSHVDSGSVGFASVFHISPDARYLFREQKIKPGIGGAYLYHQIAGPRYEIAEGNLYLRVCEFFTRTTNLHWENAAGVVEFAAWDENDSVLVTVSGFSEKREFAIQGWRCLFDPSTSQFALSPAQETPNRNAIRAEAPGSVAARMPGEQYPETRLRLLHAADVQDLSFDKLRYAINEMYARHGADFHEKEIAKWFGTFTWYHRQPGRSYDQAETLFDAVETANLKLLGYFRDQRKSGQPVVSDSPPPGAAAP